MPRVERSSSPDLLLQEGFASLARAYQQEAEALQTADPEAWRFAHAKIGDVLMRLTHELEQRAAHQAHEPFRRSLSDPKILVLHEIGREVGDFVEACAPTAVGETFGPPSDDDPTPRTRLYPLPTLAEKARKTDEAIVLVGGRLTKVLGVLLETSDRFTLEPQESQLLSGLALSFDEHLARRAHWLALELQSLQFLDILARFRKLCVAYDAIQVRRQDPSFHGPAMQVFVRRLAMVADDLKRHPLGPSLLDLCTVEAFATDLDRWRVRRYLLRLEEHVLEGYGISRPRTDHLEKHRIEHIRQQEKEIASIHVRVAFLTAYFR